MRVVSSGTLYDAALAPATARFASFTTLAQLPGGRLVAAFRVGSSKDSADEDVRVMVSDDGGVNWRMQFAGFGDLPPGRGRMRALGVTPHAGRLLGALTRIDRSDPARPLADPETQGLLPAQVMYADSDDGAVWSAPREVPLAPYEGCVTTGAILVLRDGTLALPYESWKNWGDPRPGKHRAALSLSADGGRSWDGDVTIAHDASGRLLFWDQRVAITTDGSELAAMFWSHDRIAEQDASIHIAWGSADGRTWSAPQSTGIAGQICAPLYLPGGRLLASYVHRHDPPGLRAVLSADGGRNWDRAGELEFYRKQREGVESGMGGRRDFGDYWADMSVWTFGHPSPALLDDGDVLVIYYAGDSQAMGVHWVRIALEG
jgi:hypothetical protein